jgi:hypothetical protein
MKHLKGVTRVRPSLAAEEEKLIFRLLRLWNKVDDKVLS